MKKHEIARENVMTTVGRVTVAVYATDSTDKQTLSTVLYDGKSQLVSGISAQMTYRPGSGLALEDAVKNIIARTSTKYEASQRPLCEHIDYAQAYAELKSANMLHQLCPVEWRAESTRRAALQQHILVWYGACSTDRAGRRRARQRADRCDRLSAAPQRMHLPVQLHICAAARRSERRAPWTGGCADGTSSPW